MHVLAFTVDPDALIGHRQQLCLSGRRLAGAVHGERLVVEIQRMRFSIARSRNHGHRPPGWEAFAFGRISPEQRHSTCRVGPAA